MKVVAKTDITYPDKAGKPITMWKKGDEIKDKKLAEMFVARSKELVTVENDRSTKPPKTPSGAGKKK